MEGYKPYEETIKEAKEWIKTQDVFYMGDLLTALELGLIRTDMVLKDLMFEGLITFDARPGHGEYYVVKNNKNK